MVVLGGIGRIAGAFIRAAFNKTYRTDVVDCYVFESLQEVRDMTADWLHRCNHHRPNESLGRVPPVEYRIEQFPNLYF